MMKALLSGVIQDFASFPEAGKGDPLSLSGLSEVMEKVEG
jgi:hypothetical protein